jgi:hypothetical protein
MLKTRFSGESSSLRVMGSRSSGGLSMRQPRENVLASIGGEPSTRVTANFGNAFGGAPIQLNDTGGVQWSRYLTGLMPEDDAGLITYYRDCYHFDSVAGATVDMQCTYPFSDYTLVGLEQDKLTIFTENCARLDARALMAQVAMDYMVDGAFTGSLVHDGKTNTFTDVLVHDKLNLKITPSPFFNAEPIISTGLSSKLQAFMQAASSPVHKAVLDSYPREFLNAFLKGNTPLDPLTTVHIPRRSTHDQASVSYLRRVLPAYLLEKTLYRGTLLEAQRRMRATTLVTVGTDLWEPTPDEMMTVLGQLQMSEADPMGAWVVTRQGVSVQDIRTAGDFWKWTDLIDTMVPYKLRALGVSEAFLSGEASYSTAEVAMTVFTENAAFFRSMLTRAFFTNKLFPLIAVVNSLYKDPSKAERGSNIQAVLRNLSNTANLMLPEVRWHKTLDNHDPGMVDVLDKLAEKGIPVPLKMWAAASNVSLDMLLGDLAEDEKIRATIQKITGVKPDDSSQTGGEEDFGGGDFEGASASQRLRNQARNLELRSAKDRISSRRVPLLARNFVHPDGSPMDTPLKMSKSGNTVHAVYNERGARRKQHEMIVKAAKNLSNPRHYEGVKQSIIAKKGHIPNISF